MQKILSRDDNCHQNNSTECKGYDGVQTVIGITENHLVEVNFTTEHLMEYILLFERLKRWGFYESGM